MVRPKKPKVPLTPSNFVTFRVAYASAEFFDVKFYPYNPEGAPPIFAAISKKHVSWPTASPASGTAHSHACVTIKGCSLPAVSNK